MNNPLMANSFNLERLSRYAALMATGKPFKGCVFGNSKVEGNQTSSFNTSIRNPKDTVTGLAIGNPAYGENGGAKAYPKQAETILRAFYNNNQAFMFNAGYGGQEIVQDDWAIRSIDQAVTNTYGKPDVLFLDFAGVNEFNRGLSPVDGEIAPRLYDRLMDIYRWCLAGRVQLCLINSGAYQASIQSGSSSTGYENTWIWEIANEIQKRFAKEFGLPYLDFFGGMTDFIHNNLSLSWYDLLADGLHENDIGQALKGQLLAMALMPDIYVIPPGKEIRLTGSDPRDQSPFNNDTSSYFNPRIQGSAIQQQLVLSASECLGQKIIDAWVLNLNPYSRMFLDCLGASAVGTGTTESNASRLKVYDYLQPSAAMIDDLVPGQRLVFAVSSNATAAGHLRHHPMGGLGYGLHNVQIIAPNGASSGFRCPAVVIDSKARRGAPRIWVHNPTNSQQLVRQLHDGFRGDDAWKATNQTSPAADITAALTNLAVDTYDCLAQTGDFRLELNPAASSGFTARKYAYGYRLLPDFSNWASFAPYGRIIRIHLKGRLSVNAALLLFYGPSYVDDTGTAGSLIS